MGTAWCCIFFSFLSSQSVDLFFSFHLPTTRRASALSPCLARCSSASLFRSPPSLFCRSPLLASCGRCPGWVGLKRATRDRLALCTRGVPRAATRCAVCARLVRTRHTYPCSDWTSLACASGDRATSGTGGAKFEHYEHARRGVFVYRHVYRRTRGSNGDASASLQRHTHSPCRPNLPLRLVQTRMSDLLHMSCSCHIFD